MQDKNEELQEDNDRLRAKIQKLKAQVANNSDSYNGHNGHHQQQIEFLEQELVKAQQEKSHLENLLENSSVAFKELNTVLHETRDKLSESQSKLSGGDLKVCMIYFWWCC